MKDNLPITSLRNTTEIEERVKKEGKVAVAKNGKVKFLIVDPDLYEGEERPAVTKSRPATKFFSTTGDGENLGFCRVAAGTTFVHLGNPTANAKEIVSKVKECAEQGVDVLVLSELCLTGYSIGDMFLDETLLRKVKQAVFDILDKTKNDNIVFAFGAPFELNGKLYNCSFVCHAGKLLGIVPKSNIPNYTEFYEARHFAAYRRENLTVEYGDIETVFGNKVVFVDKDNPELRIGVEICEDVWVPESPWENLVKAGATVILNLSSSNEVVGKADYRRRLVSMASAKGGCVYCYADSGDGESTSDLTFASHNIIAENGKITREPPLYEMKTAISDVDLGLVIAERKRVTSFSEGAPDGYENVVFSKPISLPEKLGRTYPRFPFQPSGDISLERVSSILRMQAEGLKNRLRAIHCKKTVIGLSGGLDSTLALLVMSEAYKLLGYDPKDILAITLPCFGTSERTHKNAVDLAACLGVSFKEINISKSVITHLEDIGHAGELNVAYENAQARERTQVLMDVANDIGAIVVGTGDLSELCLGWCTYNGDHMSMYGVNCSIPKTLVRYLVKGYAIMHPDCAGPLEDILDTPISPELLPTDKEGKIEQKTEDKIGPYELHDFFIFYFLRYRFSPRKIYHIAKIAFEGVYDDATIKKWLVVFFRRFFSNQFKRNCLPDGPKVGTVSISPRGDLRLPSDAEARIWIEEAESL